MTSCQIEMSDWYDTGAQIPKIWWTFVYLCIQTLLHGIQCSFIRLNKMPRSIAHPNQIGYPNRIRSPMETWLINDDGDEHGIKYIERQWKGRSSFLKDELENWGWNSPTSSLFFFQLAKNIYTSRSVSRQQERWVWKLGVMLNEKEISTQVMVMNR